MASKASTNNKPNPALKRTATPPLSFALELAKKRMRVVSLVLCQNLLACKAESKDPFASRNAVLLSCLGIIKVSASVVRQAVFVVRPIVGARMIDKNQVLCFVWLGVVASNPAVERTCAKSRAGRSLLR